jgi:hypothetical protein
MTARYDGPASRFWALYFDPEVVTRLHNEALGSTSIEIDEQEGDLEKGVTRTLRYGQRPDAPGPVKKLFGEEIVSTEVTTYDPAASRATFTLTPGTMADKTTVTGVITVTDDGDGCEERFELEAKVRIFGAGPVVERFIERQARDMQEKAVRFLQAEMTKG